MHASAIAQELNTTIAKITLFPSSTGMYVVLDDMGTCRTDLGPARIKPEDAPLLLPMFMQAMATGRALTFTTVDVCTSGECYCMITKAVIAY